MAHQLSCLIIQTMLGEHKFQKILNNTNSLITFFLLGRNILNNFPQTFELFTRTLKDNKHWTQRVDMQSSVWIISLISSDTETSREGQSVIREAALFSSAKSAVTSLVALSGYRIQKFSTSRDGAVTRK
jgi:hypothetical protein